MKPIDLGFAPGDGTKAAELRSVPTEQIMRELLRRDCVDFSQVSLHMRLSFLYLCIVALVVVQWKYLPRWWECL
jgi:hypothetical protein